MKNLTIVLAIVLLLSLVSCADAPVMQVVFETSPVAEEVVEVGEPEPTILPSEIVASPEMDLEVLQTNQERIEQTDEGRQWQPGVSRGWLGNVILTAYDEDKSILTFEVAEVLALQFHYGPCVEIEMQIDDGESSLTGRVVKSTFLEQFGGSIACVMMRYDEIISRSGDLEYLISRTNARRVTEIECSDMTVADVIEQRLRVFLEYGCNAEEEVLQVYDVYMDPRDFCLVWLDDGAAEEYGYRWACVRNGTDTEPWELAQRKLDRLRSKS